MGNAEKAAGVKSGNLIETSSVDGIDRRGFLKCMAWAGTLTGNTLQRAEQSL
jgi:hypothetical protein